MISHEHKVIFVHVPKTGGQSIEQMFLDDLGLSWDERAHLSLRPNDDPAIGPERLAHLYAREYVEKGHVTQDQWDSYLTFAVVRNPYDRVISEYFYRGKTMPTWKFWRRPRLDGFMAQAAQEDFSDGARHIVPQANYVCDRDGNVIVDHIIRFENMGAEVEALLADVLKTPRSLPHRNKTQTGNTGQKKKARKAFEPLIAEQHAIDFDLFGYTR